MDYGLGAIFGCPAHDQRDLDFAKKYSLEVLPVVTPDKDNLKFKIDNTVTLLETEFGEVNISEIDAIICGSLHALKAIHDKHEAQLKAKLNLI